MRIVGLPGSFYYASRIGPIKLSWQAHWRLEKLKLWERLREEGYSGEKAAELAGVSRASLYRWQRRVRERGLKGLEDDSRRPKRCRRRTWSPELSEAIQVLRERHGWGKAKLTVLLRREG